MSGNRLRSMLDLPGAVVPPLTPFRPDGSVDYPTLEAEIEFLLAHGRPAVIAAAAVEVQEYQYLSDSERGELIRRTVAAVRGRVPVAVGVSHPSTRKARALCDLAREVGADAIQCLIPNRPSGGTALPEELVAYFQAIAQASDRPIFAYHNPGPGAEVTPQVLHALFQVPGVEAFKESSRNLRHIGLAKSLLPPEACYFCTMEVLLATLELDCAGGTMPPPGSLLGMEVIQAFRRGDLETARRYQRMFTEFPARWMRYGLAAVMKVAMEAIGVPVGDAYPPFAVLPPEDREAIAAYVKSLPLPREVS